MPASIPAVRLPSCCLCLLCLLALAVRSQTGPGGSSTTADISPDLSLRTLLRHEIGEREAALIESAIDSKGYGNAEEALAKRIQTSAHSAVLLQVLGSILFRDAKYLPSAIAFKKAEQYGALPEKARFTLAMDYVELKRNTWAHDELARLEKAQPLAPLYPYWQGRVAYDDQQFAAARTSFRKSVALDPSFVRAYDGLGLCEEALGQESAAEENYRRANFLNRRQGSRFAWPPLDYGILLRKQSRYPEAKALLKEASHIDPVLAKAYYELGRLEESTAQWTSAITNLQTAAALDPHDAASVYALARLYQTTGRKELAAAALERFRLLKAQLSGDR